MVTNNMNLPRINYFSGPLLFMILIIAGCSDNKQPAIALDVDECAHCKMVISKMNEACGYFVDNEFVTFDSPGCLLSDYEETKKNETGVPKKIYFVDYISSEFVPADSTYFFLSSHIPTVMNAGVLCFSVRDSAQSYKKYQDETITDWIGFQVLRGTPDKRIEVTVTPDGMQPEVIVLNKNEIIEWVFCGKGLQQEVDIYLKGYDEMGKIEISSTGNSVAVRMLAKHPGAGFPFVRSRDEKPIGMVKVLGPHTSDEEIM